eukprot:Clim_evm27s156 gene=Clim_evmTU27s156
MTELQAQMEEWAMELEMLQSIYPDEVELLHDWTDTDDNGFRIHLHPRTGDDEDARLLLIILRFDMKRADGTVNVDIEKSRGLDPDEYTKLLVKSRDDLLEGKTLYECIEDAQSYLTDCNDRPGGVCAICLEPSDARPEMKKTSCYHLMHKRCLGKWLNYMTEYTEKGVPCPVCGRPIDVSDVSPVPPLESAWDAKTSRTADIPDSIRTLQDERGKLFQIQRAKGGIIDKDMRENVFVLTSSSHGQQSESSSERM